MSPSGTNLLAIETARDACGVAVLRADGVVSTETCLRPRSHAEQLVPMALRVVALAHLTFSDIEVIAVSAGPGSYTGLRIGVSTAKGFATAYGADIVGVPTLQAYAHASARHARASGDSPDLTIVALKARRQELYFGAYESGDDSAAPTVVIEAAVLEVPAALRRIRELAADRRVAVVGDASSDLVARAETRNVIGSAFVSGAESVGRIGLARAAVGHFDDLRSFEPYYLKDFVVRDSGSAFKRLPD